MKSLFLCESCGKQVSYKTNRCPYCGRFFSAVVCPKCLYTGKAGEFLSGCPGCGYSGYDPMGKEATGKKKSPQKGKKKWTGFLLSKKKKNAIELPFWFYKVAGIGILLILLSIIIWYVSSMM